MSIIAVSCLGPSLKSMVDSRFGRSRGFLIVNSDNMEFEYIDNSGISDITGGAGIKTAEMIAQKGVDIVLTGSVGPKASTVLSIAKIKFFEGFDNMTVEEAINKFKS